jgi:hypothetical protein
LEVVALLSHRAGRLTRSDNSNNSNSLWALEAEVVLGLEPNHNSLQTRSEQMQQRQADPFSSQEPLRMVGE